MPERCQDWMRGWLEHHPGWAHRVWNDESRPTLRNEELFLSVDSRAQRADILRYELVLEYGGVYLDADMECIRSIEGLISGCEAFIAEEDPGRVAIGIFGATPGHRWLQQTVTELPTSWRDHDTIPEQTGPGFATRVIRHRSDVVIFEPELFYPYSYREPHRAGETFPDAYAVHHWTKSWAADEVMAREREQATERARITELRASIESIVAPNSTVLLIDGGEELGLEGSRETIRFSQRPGYWGNPPDSGEAIAEFERLYGRGIDWVVFLEAADWWFEYYAEFADHVQALSSDVVSGERFRAFRVNKSVGAR